jgi:hypothetical protein
VFNILNKPPRQILQGAGVLDHRSQAEASACVRHKTAVVA